MVIRKQRQQLKVPLANWQNNVHSNSRPHWEAEHVVSIIKSSTVSGGTSTADCRHYWNLIGESVIHWKWVKVRQISQVDVLCLLFAGCGSVKCSLCPNIRIQYEGGHLTVCGHVFMITTCFSWTSGQCLTMSWAVMVSGRGERAEDSTRNEVMQTRTEPDRTRDSLLIT